jgi:hypothetical protein
VQGFDDDRPLLGRGLHGLGAFAQCLQPGLFQLSAAPVINAQATGDGRQVGALMDFALELLRALEDSDEGVVGQVRGIEGVAQATTQQLVQPAMVAGVEVLHE